MEARVGSLRVGLPRLYGTEGAAGLMDRPWTTGFYKEPVAGAVWLGRTNLAGDGQADLQHHGGPDKAVCVYPALHYPYWSQRLAEEGAVTDPLPWGAFGENVTVEGQTEDDVCIGDVYRLGGQGALVQVTLPRSPCWKLARRWRVRRLALWVQETGYTGWYVRVLEEGMVAASDLLALVERPRPQWTIARANQVAYAGRERLDLVAELAAVPELGASWQQKLARRAETGAATDDRPRLLGQHTAPEDGDV